MTVPVLCARDLQFLLYEWLDAESLTARERFAEHSRDAWDAFLEVAARVAAERFAPCNKFLDATSRHCSLTGRLAFPPKRPQRCVSWPIPE
jgi:hypothetical protein